VRTRSTVVTVVLLASCGLVTGCGDQSAGSDRPSGGTAQAEAAKGWPRFDPPTRFEVAKGVELPEGITAENVLLHGTKAFAGVDEGLLPVDLPTGKPGTLVKAARPPLPVFGNIRDGRLRTPVLAELGGRSVAVVPLLVTIPAQGTTRAGHGIDVVVADAATGEPVSVVQLDLADDDVDDLTVEGSQVLVTGVSGSLVVLLVGDGLGVVLDLATGKETWRRRQFRPGALIGDTVVGVAAQNSYEKQDAVGLAVRDGQKRWTALTGLSLVIHAAGPHFALGTGGHSEGFYAVIRPDGSVADRDDGDFNAMRCRYDQVSVTVCGYDKGLTPVFALDSETHKLLWSLPDEAARRAAPTVTAVWHGMVYGEANDQPVVIDARTGADREVSPGLAPQAVSAHAGLGVSPRSTGGQVVMVHPAAG
jgi:hypothetical protein